MRILFVGPWNSGSTLHRSTVAALESLGHHVTVFDNRANRHRILRYLPERAARSFRYRIGKIERANRRAINHEIIGLAKTSKPDIVLVSKGDGVEYSTVFKLRSLGCIVVNWFPDAWQQWTWVQEMAFHYDFFFAYDALMAESIRKLGHKQSHHLPFACDPQLHRRLELSQDEMSQLSADICFVGGPYPERINYLLSLANHDLALYGPVSWQDTPLADRYRGQVDNGEAMVRLYNACRIAINIHWQDQGSGANFRTLEIAACGGALQVVDRRLDVEKMFRSDSEIVIFDDAPDLQKKVRRFLEYPSEAASISRRGQERAHRDHKFETRMIEMLALITAAYPGRETIPPEYVRTVKGEG